MLEQNFAYILEKKRATHPKDIAIIEAFNSKAYSYDDLCRRVSRLANALTDAGINKGDRIICLTANTVEYFDIFMAAARLGLLLIPINYRLAPFEMMKIVNDAKPKAFIFDAEFGNAAKEIATATPNLSLIFLFGNGEYSWASRMEEIVGQYPESGPEIVGDSEDPLLMLYTAGSTGKPKGVPMKQTNLFFSTINWIIDYGITKNDYSLTVIPLFHIAGHMVWTLPHLVVGAKVLLQRRFEPEMTLRLIEQEKITNVWLASAMIKMILSLPNWKDYDLSSLRFVGVGGEPVPEKILSAFAEIKIPILPDYGLTETTDGTIAVRLEDTLGKPGNCLGKPLTLTDARIVDKEGRDVGFGVEGELLHRGPSIVDAYWNNPEAGAKTFHDGWIHTGDIVVRDEKGFIYFIARKDELIITGGENVYPAEIEDIILGYPKVADVAVIGIPDEKWGQTIKAVIAPKSGTIIKEEEIIEYIKTRLSSFKRPRIIQFVEPLPRIGSGKMDRVKIKDMYGKNKK